MKISKIIIIFVIIILFSIGITSFFFTLTQIIKVEEFKIAGQIGEKHGFGFNSSHVLFGKVKPGGAGWRKFSVKNYEDYPIEAFFQTTGNISEYIFPEFDTVVIPPGNHTLIKVDFAPPLNSSFGNYSGTFKIILKRHKN